MSEAPSILFYEVKDPYGFCSNFYPAQISYRGKIYPSSEHAFQAAKFLFPGANPDSQKYAELIRTERSAAKIFALASQKIKGGFKWRTDLNPIISEYLKNGVHLRPDWEETKVEVMTEILRAKFDQHADLREALFQTHGCSLVEHTPRDSFWGDGGDGKGKNMLGKLLIELRQAYFENGDYLIPTPSNPIE